MKLKRKLLLLSDPKAQPEDRAWTGIIKNPNIIRHVKEEIRAKVVREKIIPKFKIGSQLYEKLKKNEDAAMKRPKS